MYRMQIALNVMTRGQPWIRPFCGLVRFSLCLVDGGITLAQLHTSCLALQHLLIHLLDIYTQLTHEHTHTIQIHTPVRTRTQAARGAKPINLMAFRRLKATSVNSWHTD